MMWGNWRITLLVCLLSLSLTYLVLFLTGEWPFQPKNQNQTSTPTQQTQLKGADPFTPSPHRIQQSAENQEKQNCTYPKTDATGFKFCLQTKRTASLFLPWAVFRTKTGPSYQAALGNRQGPVLFEVTWYLTLGGYAQW